MPSKKDHAFNFLKDDAALFRCPVCGGALRLAEPFVKCESGHNFTVSKKGVAVLLHTSKLKQSPIYNKALFEARRRFIGCGFYGDTHRAIASLINNSLPPALKEQLVLLDIGCGEGSHGRAVREALLPLPCKLVGFDLSKESVEMAGDYLGESAFFFVGDVTNVPMGDGQVDVALNYLSPYQTEEVLRLLAPGGLFIKVVPGNEYLAELRALTGIKPYSGYGEGAQKITGQMALTDTVHITKTFALNPEERLDAYHMTPMTQNIHIDEGAIVDKLTHITIDLIINCYEKTLK